MAARAVEMQIKSASEKTTQRRAPLDFCFRGRKAQLLDGSIIEYLETAWPASLRRHDFVMYFEELIYIPIVSRE